MITSLLKWAYATGIELWIENGKLKYRAEQGVLTEKIKRQLIDNKEIVIKRLEQNAAAKLKEWMAFDFGEMYSKRTAENTMLCIFRNDNDTFTVWRASYRSGVFRPFNERTIIAGVAFKTAFERANSYCEWSSTNNKSKSKRAG